MVKLNFTSSFPEAVVREGADELTLRGRRGKKKKSCAPSSTPRTWETADGRRPLADEDWHAICQAINKGVGAAEWESM